MPLIWFFEYSLSVCNIAVCQCKHSSVNIFCKHFHINESFVIRISLCDSSMDIGLQDLYCAPHPTKRVCKEVRLHSHIQAFESEPNAFRRFCSAIISTSVLQTWRMLSREFSLACCAAYSLACCAATIPCAIQNKKELFSLKEQARV